MRTKFHQIAQLQAIQCSKKGKKYCNENICKIGTKYPLAKNNPISKAKKSRCLKIYSILLYSLSPPINAHSKLRLALFRKKALFCIFQSIVVLLIVFPEVVWQLLPTIAKKMTKRAEHWCLMQCTRAKVKGTQNSTQ